MARYAAFVSYSRADSVKGEWVHRSLERYRVPRPLRGQPGIDGPVPQRIFPVFRDREELASSADLGAQLQAALEASAFLVVVCSPAAARSHWVNEEVLAFKRMGRADRILAIIVDGEPNATGSTNPERECFPPALRFRLTPDGTLGPEPTEPLAADARDLGDGPANALLKLIAGLLGVGYDQLRQRELEAARHRARVTQTIAASMVLLALTAVAGGVLSWFGSQVSREHLRAAQRAQSLAVLEKVQNEPPKVAVPALLTVLPRDVAHEDRPFVPQVAAQLALALDQWTDHADIEVHPPEPVQTLRFAGNALRLLATSGLGPSTVGVYDVGSGSVVGNWHFPQGILTADIAGDGRTVALSVREPHAPMLLYRPDRSVEPPVPLWLPATAARAGRVRKAVLTGDRAIVAEVSAAAGDMLVAFDPDTGGILDVATEPCRGMTAASRMDRASGIGLLSCLDGSLIAMKLGRHIARIGMLEAAGDPSGLPGLDKVRIALSGDGTTLAVSADGTDRVIFYSATTGARLGGGDSGGHRIVGLFYAGDTLLTVEPNGRWVARNPMAIVHTFDRPPNAQAPGELVRGALLSSDGAVLMLALTSGALESWAWREDRKLARKDLDGAPFTAGAINHAGNAVLFARPDGSIDRFDLTELKLTGHWTGFGDGVAAIDTVAADDAVLIIARDRHYCLLDTGPTDARPDCRDLPAGDPLVIGRRAGSGDVVLRDRVTEVLTLGSRRLMPPESEGADLVRFGNTGKFIAVQEMSSNGTATVVNLADHGVRLRSIPLGGAITGFEFDSTDRYLAVRGFWGVAVLDIAGGKAEPIWHLADRSVRSAVFAGNTLLVGRDNDSTLAISTENWQPVSGPHIAGAILAVTGDGQTLLTTMPGAGLASLNNVAVWKAGAAAHLSQFASTMMAIADVSSDGAYIAMASPAETVVRVLETRSVPGVTTLPMETRPTPIKSAGFVPGGRWLVTGAESGRISVIDIATNVVKKSDDCACGMLTGIFVDDAGKRALAVGHDAAVLFALPELTLPKRVALPGPATDWPAADGILSLLVLEGIPTSQLLPLPGAGREVADRVVGDGLDLSLLKTSSLLWVAHNGKRLAYAQNTVVHWLDPTDSAPPQRSSTLGQIPRIGALDDSGRWLVLWLADNTLHLVDLDSGREQRIGKEIADVASIAFFGPTGRQRLLLRLTDGHAFVLEPTEGAVPVPLATASGTPVLTDAVAAAGPNRLVGVLQAPGPLLGQGVAMVWDAATLLPLKTMEFPRPGPRPVVFMFGQNGTAIFGSDDGRHALVAREGATAALLNLEAPDWQAVIERACKRIQARLTDAEKARLYLTDAPPSWRSNSSACCRMFLRGCSCPARCARRAGRFDQAASAKASGSASANAANWLSVPAETRMQRLSGATPGMRTKMPRAISPSSTRLA